MCPLGGARSMEVAPGTTMQELRDMLGLPVDEVRVITATTARLN
jgi:hypothetical protein